jgi:hypothetical protein
MVPTSERWASKLEKDYEAFMTPYLPRKASAISTTSSSHSANSSPISTRSDGCPFSSGVVFERSSPRSEDLIYIVVKLARETINEYEELPSRYVSLILRTPSCMGRPG